MAAGQVAHFRRDVGFAKLAAVGRGDLYEVSPAGEARAHADGECVDWKVACAAVEQETDGSLALNAAVRQEKHRIRLDKGGDGKRFVHRVAQAKLDRVKP